jgi:hypothetical protein
VNVKANKCSTCRLPASLRQERIYFSIARLPLDFKDPVMTVISTVCCARYRNIKFIHIPFRLTLHKLSPQTKRKNALPVVLM